MISGHLIEANENDHHCHCDVNKINQGIESIEVLFSHVLDKQVLEINEKSSHTKVKEYQNNGNDLVGQEIATASDIRDAILLISILPVY